MQSSKIIREVCMVMTILLSLIVLCGCRKDMSLESSKGEKEVDNRCELLGRKFEDLITATNITLSVTRGKLYEICKTIEDIPDKKESFKMFDQFLEMTISKNVAIEEYNCRQNWYAALWFASMYTFLGAQSKLECDYKYWDKMFRFFEKYTDEIKAVELMMPSTHYSKWAKSDIDREVYLRGIKGDLKTWVRVLRDFYYPQISKNFTEKQKKDIIQRFKQVSECTKMTPYIPMR